MEDPDRAKLDAVWEQRDIPVLVNRGKGYPLRVRLPEGVDAFTWIKDGRRRNPEWWAKYSCWKAPRAWFDDLTRKALNEFGKVYLIQTFQSQEKCARICQEAKGFACDCSCEGENHGANNMDGWMEVSETFATRWSDPKTGYRLLTKKPFTRAQELLIAAAILV